MKLLVLKSVWGMDGSLRDKLAQIAADGYDGIEAGGAPEIPPAEWRKLLREYGLQGHIALVGGGTPEELAANLERLRPYDPLRVVVHAGRDSMTLDEGKRFFEQALKVEQRFGLTVGYETHRGRLLYNPWDTLASLREFPELRINVDFSHWVCVCERLPDDQPEAMALACQRAIHIHGRVGYEEGPQAPDPAAPEYAGQVDWHERQWDRVRQAHEAAGAEILTFTPEFGPPGYLHALPYTGAPVADLRQICLWSTRRIRQRWSDLVQEPAPAGRATALA